VPLLVLPAGEKRGGEPVAPDVLTESLAIMEWAEKRQAPSPAPAPSPAALALIAENDGPFKHHLDRYRYASRFADADPGHHRAEALAILRRWSARLAPGGWLLGDHPSLADRALLPFVRQFRLADPAGFDAEDHLGPLQGWLRRFLEGDELARVMADDWAPRDGWRSSGWLYHLALAEEWRAAAAGGEDAAYRRSTRGLALEAVGFVHASGADQIEATYRRFYADAGEVLLLTIDPARLQAAGVPVHWEPAPESGERFPHIHGALPVNAVLKAEPYRPSGAQRTGPIPPPLPG
jgi:glutathione S-transferase